MIQSVVKHDEIGKPVAGRRTLGGKQLWTDWRWAAGWRVQRHCCFDSARLLDPRNRLVTSGSFAACEASLDRYIHGGSVLSTQREAVILLHGLCRTRSSLARMERAIRRQTDLETIRLSYSSTRHSIGQSARALRYLIEHLDRVPRFNFLCHSMGNLVVRRMLYDLKADKQTIPLGRMVMLAPPNQGSAMARWLKFSLLFNSIAGVGGREFSWNWNDVSKKLAVPECEFAVIAGAQKYRWLSNPLLPGKDDWTVTRAETVLEGETDRLEGPFLHGMIMLNRRVIDASVKFLQCGSID